MDPNLTPEQRKEAAELLPIFLDSFKILLASLEARLIDRQSDNPNEDIGKIDIIVDPDGMLAKCINAKPRNVRGGFVLITVSTKEAAYRMEKLLAGGACDTPNIGSIIALIDPRYADPAWIEDLDIAADEVARVLVNARVLVPGLPIYTLLQKAARQTHADAT